MCQNFNIRTDYPCFITPGVSTKKSWHSDELTFECRNVCISDWECGQERGVTASFTLPLWGWKGMTEMPCKGHSWCIGERGARSASELSERSYPNFNFPWPPTSGPGWSSCALHPSTRAILCCNRKSSRQSRPFDSFGILTWDILLFWLWDLWANGSQEQ